MKTSEIVEYAQQIPLEELFDEIRHILNIPDLKFRSKIVVQNDKVYIEFNSDYIETDKMGCLRAILPSDTIVSDGKVSVVNVEVRNKDIYKVTFSTDVRLSYDDNKPIYTFMHADYDSQKGHFSFKYYRYNFS